MVAELAAVFRPTAPGGNPAPVTQTASHPAARESAAAAGTSAVKVTQPGQVTGAEEAGEAEGRDRQGPKGRAALPAAHATGGQERVFSTARMPLLRAELLYRDVASTSGISWKLLAACDWMQCEARARLLAGPRREARHRERGRHRYRTKSEALSSAPTTWWTLAETVYGST